MQELAPSTTPLLSAVLTSKFNNIYKHSGKTTIFLFWGQLPFSFGKMHLFTDAMLNFRNEPVAKTGFVIHLKDDSVT